MSAPVTPKTNDAHWVTQTLQGDQKAFRHLVTQYSSQVYNLIYRMTQNLELADELTQEVFVKVYRKLNTYDPQRPFKPWLLRVASNTAISELRRRAKVVSLDAMSESGSLNELETQPAGLDMAGQVEAKLSSEVILAAIGRLDPRYRQVLLLRYKDELSYEEIAEVAEVPLNTVRTWIKRGRDALRVQVEGVLAS